MQVIHLAGAKKALELSLPRLKLPAQLKVMNIALLLWRRLIKFIHILKNIKSNRKGKTTEPNIKYLHFSIGKEWKKKCKSREYWQRNLRNQNLILLLI